MDRRQNVHEIEHHQRQKDAKNKYDVAVAQTSWPGALQEKIRQGLGLPDSEEGSTWFLWVCGAGGMIAGLIMLGVMLLTQRGAASMTGRHHAGGGGVQGDVAPGLSANHASSASSERPWTSASASASEATPPTPSARGPPASGQGPASHAASVVDYLKLKRSAAQLLPSDPTTNPNLCASAIELEPLKIEPRFGPRVEPAHLEGVPVKAGHRKRIQHGIGVGVERGAETGGSRAAAPSAQGRKSAETQVARGSGAASGSSRGS
eukprot:2593889-Rhodomonas_salina.1